MGQWGTEMENTLLSLCEKISSQTTQSQGYLCHYHCHNQVKLEFSKTEVGCSCAQRRAGSIPWAAVALQLFWQVLKSVKKKKKERQKKKKKINLLWIKRPNKLSLNFNSVLHLQHTEMQLTVASVHTR